MNAVLSENLNPFFPRSFNQSSYTKVRDELDYIMTICSSSALEDLKECLAHKSSYHGNSYDWQTFIKDRGRGRG